MKKKKIIIVVIVLAIVCAAAVWLFTYGPLAQKDIEETEETEDIEKVCLSARHSMPTLPMLSPRHSATSDHVR